jgi:hypothetical protein
MSWCGNSFLNKCIAPAFRPGMTELNELALAENFKIFMDQAVVYMASFLASHTCAVE